MALSLVKYARVGASVRRLMINIYNSSPIPYFSRKNCELLNDITRRNSHVAS